jgi:hypothetical protein
VSFDPACTIDARSNYVGCVVASATLRRQHKRASRDDTEFAEPGKLPPEAVVCVDTIRKARLPNLDCAQDCFLAEVEHPVHERPVCDLSVRRGVQAVAVTMESHSGAFSLISETVDIARGSATGRS